MVAVAQLVESRIVIPVVVGSSPISHPKYIKACSDASLFLPSVLLAQYDGQAQKSVVISLPGFAKKIIVVQIFLMK